jgi:hypothetical protein
MLAQDYNIPADSSTVEWVGYPSERLKGWHRYTDNPLMDLITAGLSDILKMELETMAYTIKYLGYDVTCDSPEDLRALLNSTGTPPKPAVHPNLFGEEPATGVAGFVAKVQGKPRELLRIIATGGTVPRDRLSQAVGVLDPHKFGGLLITISKCAASAGIEAPIERSMVRLNGNGPRVYHYKIRDNIKAELKAALSV